MTRPDKYERLADETQAILLESAEARAERAAEKLAALPVTFHSKLRGQHPPEVDLTQLIDMAENPLPDDKLEVLSGRLPVHRPLFSRFTSHNRFVPSPRSLQAYLDANRHKTRVAPTEPDEYKAWMQATERRPYNIEDKVQQGLFVDRNIARLRRAALATTRYQLWRNTPLDETAAIFAADAVREFGFTLYDNPEFLEDIGGRETALHIAAIGEASADNLPLLAENFPLLSIVEREQENRERFWDARYQLTVEFCEDRLTRQHKDDGIWTDNEVARLQALCEA